MSHTGQRRRNRSCVNGSLAHTFEYYYCGDLSKDIIVTADVFIDSLSDFHDRSGPRPSNFEVVSDSVGRAATPDQCFEFWGIFKAIFPLKDLHSSVFCRPEDWPDLFDMIRSCDLVSHIVDRTSLDDLTGVYAVFKPQGLDDTDQLYLILLFK